MHDLVLTDNAWRTILRGFAADAGRVAFGPAGLNRHREGTELLVHRIEWAGEQGGREAGEQAAERALVLVWAATDPAAPLPDIVRQAMARNEGNLVAGLALGWGTLAGHATGFFTHHPPNDLRPLARVKVIGPGLPCFDLTAGLSLPLPYSHTPTLPAVAGSGELWSRAIGALGEEAWQRLVGLRVGLVGAGRSGSVAAESLVRLGVRRLALVDPDWTELHNLDAMNGVGLADVGRPKVEALAEHLRSLPAAPEVTAVQAGILDWSALAALKPCDVLVCCVDNPAARFATAFLSVLYLKPLLDVGTGIFRAHTPTLGADVRFVLPGEACLLDLGGVGDLARAHAEPLSATPTHPLTHSLTHHLTTSPEREAWWQERAGSLRSLNALAVHLGLRLLEEFVAGRLRESVWLQGDFDAAGLPSLRPAAAPRRPCPLCALAAQGDAGVGRWREMLENLSQ